MSFHLFFWEMGCYFGEKVVKYRGCENLISEG